jgi:hypothetical protein
MLVGMPPVAAAPPVAPLPPLLLLLVGFPPPGALGLEEQASGNTHNAAAAN